MLLLRLINIKSKILSKNNEGNQQLFQIDIVLVIGGNLNKLRST